MAKTKYQFWKRYTSANAKDGVEVARIYNGIRNTLNNRFYNLWMNKFEWSDLDEEMKEQEENYVMRKFWSEGTIAAHIQKKTGFVIFCPYQISKYNWMDFPTDITLVNVRGVSEQIIPQGNQVLNKDACIVWCQPNHKPIKEIVDWYIDRMAQVEMVINTNLNLQKMPWLIAVDSADGKKMEDVIDKILNNELVIFSDVESLAKIQSVATNTPYIIDKLKSYQCALENDLMTFLGVQNSGVAEKKAQMTVDEVNANNDSINDYGAAIEDEINRGFERFNKVFNRSISVKAKSVAVDSTSDYEDADITQSKEDSENDN